MWLKEADEEADVQKRQTLIYNFITPGSIPLPGINLTQPEYPGEHFPPFHSAGRQVTLKIHCNISEMLFMRENTKHYMYSHLETTPETSKSASSIRNFKPLLDNYA